MKKKRRSKRLHFSAGSAKKAPQGSTITAFFVHLRSVSVVVLVMVNLSGGEQRAILSHFFCNKGGNRTRGSYIHRFEDTVGDWLIGFEIVLLFF